MIDIDRLELKNMELTLDGDIAILRLNRPTKRNALDAETIEELVDFFTALPQSGVKAVLLTAAGEHFSAGLDLVEHYKKERGAVDFMNICMRWHEAFNKMAFFVDVLIVLSLLKTILTSWNDRDCVHGLDEGKDALIIIGFIGNDIVGLKARE